MKSAAFSGFTGALLLAAGLVATPAVNADVVAGVNYHHANFDTIGRDFSLGLVSGTVGYRMNGAAESFTLTPEFRLGTGLSDDRERGVTLDAERFYGVNLRAQWATPGDTYLYLVPSYTNFKVRASSGAFRATDDEWELGGGVGFGINWTGNASVEFSYERFDDLDLFGVGLRTAF